MEELLAIALIGWAWLYLPLKHNAFGMRRTQNIKPGAEIVSVKPMYVGAWGGGKQTRIIIEFSDGSFYRARFGKAGPIFDRDKIQYTQQELEFIKQVAIGEHEKVAAKKAERSR